jgi:predicted DNA-binding protein YlxM (UPF0122 family)
MTRITEQQSKEMFELWNEGNLSKSEVAERSGTSEDVVKYHIRKQQAQSASHVQALETPTATAVLEMVNEPSSGIKGLLKRLLGTEDEGKVLERLAAKLWKVALFPLKLSQKL